MSDSKSIEKYAEDPVHLEQGDVGRSIPVTTDRAAAIVADGKLLDVSVEENRRVLRKIDTWVMREYLMCRNAQLRETR